MSGSDVRPAGLRFPLVSTLYRFDALRSRRCSRAGEVEATSSRRSSKPSVIPYSVYLHTAAGRVRTILWGDYMELQKFREPIVKYLEDKQAPPLEVTMWPSTHPWRMIANAIVCVGLLCWVWLPVQIAVFLTRWVRA